MPRASYACPHCRKAIGSSAREGGVMVRLRATIISPNGTVHGPCPECRQDVIVSEGGQLSKALRPRVPIVVFRIRRRGS